MSAEDYLKVFEALMGAFQRNVGGTAILILLQIWTMHGLWQCKRDHKKSRQNEGRLAAVVAELHGALAAFTGRRVVEVEALTRLLDPDARIGGAIKYKRKRDVTAGAEGETEESSQADRHQ